MPSHRYQQAKDRGIDDWKVVRPTGLNAFSPISAGQRFISKESSSATCLSQCLLTDISRPKNPNAIGDVYVALSVSMPSHRYQQAKAPSWRNNWQIQTSQCLLTDISRPKEKGKGAKGQDLAKSQCLLTDISRPKYITFGSRGISEFVSMPSHRYQQAKEYEAVKSYIEGLMSQCLLTAGQSETNSGLALQLG